MTLLAKRKALTAALKEEGYSNRRVSVTQFSTSYGLNVHIKDAGVNNKRVWDICQLFKEEQIYDTCNDPYVGTGCIINIHGFTGGAVWFYKK